MSAIGIAVVGDRFMKPEAFARALQAVNGLEFDIRLLEQPWPDEPMHHGYADPALEGLKEFMGRPEEIAEFIGEARVLVTHLAPVTETVLERCPGLELIAVSRGGPVNVDREAVKRRGIRLISTPGRNADAVAEFTIGAILAETRLIRAGHEALRAGTWRGDLYRADRTGRELREMTVGVIGYGHIGSRLVRLLRPFGPRILVADPYVQLSREDQEAGVVQLSLDSLLEQADVVTLHARVTPETTGFLGRAQFERMKPGALFVNTARGPMVDYEALYEALASDHLGGAMLETFAVEPVPSDWPLLQLPNVTVTPHIAGASVRTITLAAEMIAEDVRRHFAGEPPIHEL